MEKEDNCVWNLISIDSKKIDFLPFLPIFASWIIKDLNFVFGSKTFLSGCQRISGNIGLLIYVNKLF